MSDLSHGVATYSQLRATGLRRSQIDQLVSAGRLNRVRRGWYALPAADPEVVRAVRAGGSLSCVSALRRYGVWVPASDRLHVRMSEHHRSSIATADFRVCGAGRDTPTEAVDPLQIALLTAIPCLDDEGIVVVLDSLRNLRLFSLHELEVLLAAHSGRVRRLLAMTVANSESGTETMVRFRLRRKRIKVRCQVLVPGVGRVDLLVGDRLVLEVDSREHHTGQSGYTRDRERDRKLVRLGYVVVRLTYAQVVYGWDEVWPDLLAVIRANGHNWPRRIRGQVVA